jgi:hypothetical protein
MSHINFEQIKEKIAFHYIPSKMNKKKVYIIKIE